MLRASFLLSSCAIAAGLASPAEAADADGFYIGVQSGWQQTGDHYHGVWKTTPPMPWDLGTHSGDGATGGVHVGYEHHIGGAFVGAEADLEATSPKADWVMNGWRMTAKPKAQGSLRARIGFSPGKTQIYITGGFATAAVEHTYRVTAPESAEFYSHNRTMTGYSVGAGLGYRGHGPVSVHIEYRYAGFGQMETEVSPAWQQIDLHRVRTHAVQVGVSYRL